MAEDKGEMGFLGAIKRFQKQRETEKLLIGKLTSWQEIFNKASADETKKAEDLNKALTSGKADKELLILLAMLENHRYMEALIGKLGIELTETHQRLAKIEETLEKLEQ